MKRFNIFVVLLNLILLAACGVPENNADIQDETTILGSTLASEDTFSDNTTDEVYEDNTLDFNDDILVENNTDIDNRFDDFEVIESNTVNDVFDTDIKDSDIDSNTVEAINELNATILSELFKQDYNQVCISGYSVSQVFSLLQPYTKDEYKSQLQSILVEDNKLKTSNIIVLDDTLVLNNEINDDAILIHDLHSMGIVDIMNKFANESTNGFIPEMITTPYDVNTVSVLANAVYFKGDWKEPFEKECNTDESFRGISGDKVTTYMNKHSHYKYNGTNMIELDYKDSSLVLDIIKDVDFNNFNIILNNYINDIGMTDFRYMDIRLKLPKFEINGDYDFTEILKDTQYGTILAESSVMPKLVDNVKIDEVNQITRIRVDEEGTEAAAITSVKTVGASLIQSEIIDFYVDSPFIYAIRDTKTNTIIFMGFVKDFI